MTQPKVAAKSPVQIDLEKGEHHWCACGESKAQPFCDGSHRGTPFTPLAFTVDEPQQAHLCMCKHTKNPPYCDGSHTRLGALEPGDPAPQQQTNGPPKVVPTPEEPTVARIHAMAAVEFALAEE